MFWQLPAIRTAPDIIFTIPGINFPVSNTLLCTWITIILLVAFFYAGIRRKSLIPTGVQNAAEFVVEYLLGLVDSVVGGNKEKGKKFFPLVATFFLFIIVANLLDVIPGVDTVGAIDGEGIAKLHTTSQPVLGFLLFGNISNQVIPWIRPATSDLNLTLAMALISVITTQIFGFYTLGAREHLSKYFTFKSPIDFIVGLLELISEFARVLSFAFRLFGNIFAGSAVLAVFAFLLPFVADIAFIPFELFVAFVQALVFALLTLVFLDMATTGHGHTDDERLAHEIGQPAPELETSATK